MTPKEKAKELYNSIGSPLSATTAKHRVKKCALIAVQYIIDSFPTFPTIEDKVFEDPIFEHISAEDYWNEVKKEIEQL
mgnify:CR=1 FL=1